MQFSLNLSSSCIGFYFISPMSAKIYSTQFSSSLSSYKVIKSVYCDSSIIQILTFIFMIGSNEVLEWTMHLPDKIKSSIVYSSLTVYSNEGLIGLIFD